MATSQTNDRPKIPDIDKIKMLMKMHQTKDNTRMPKGEAQGKTQKDR